MKTAEEMNKIANSCKWGSFDSERQLNQLMCDIEAVAKSGSLYFPNYTGEISPDNIKILESLGYRVKSGGLNSSSQWYDVIYW